MRPRNEYIFRTICSTQFRIPVFNMNIALPQEEQVPPTVSRSVFGRRQIPRGLTFKTETASLFSTFLVGLRNSAIPDERDKKKFTQWSRRGMWGKRVLMIRLDLLMIDECLSYPQLFYFCCVCICYYSRALQMNQKCLRSVSRRC